MDVIGLKFVTVTAKIRKNRSSQEKENKKEVILTKKLERKSYNLN